MIVPGRLTLVVAAVLSLLLVSAVIDSRLALIALPADAILILIFSLQGRRLRGMGIEVSQQSWHRVQVGRLEILSYRIANRSGHAVIVRVRQLFPVEFTAEQTTFELTVAAGEIVTAALSVTPRIRGTVTIAPADVDIHFHSDWAALSMVHRAGRAESFPQPQGNAFLRTASPASCIEDGRFASPAHAGAGREFDQLGEYTPDDDYRDVNWKATARRNRPISNVYQAERSREVILCIDCGRMMGNPVGDVTALDHAVDAAILLAHVANRQGDRVGTDSFPRCGASHHQARERHGRGSANHG